MKLNNLFTQICIIKDKYNKHREENRFNIFTALHKEYDEVNLHSRFISYLMASNSGHGYKSKFAEVFIREVLQFDNDKFDLSNYEVIPNEENKSEFKEIDILIINKVKKQAIIIENKIFASDSNHTDKIDGYNGQLERYYNTIKSGIDKDGNKSFDFKCDTVFVFYLTLDNHEPSQNSIGENDLKKNSEILKCISYDNHIRNWLEQIIKIIDKNSIIKSIIQQYLNLINKMTNNDIEIKERLELKEKVAEDLGNARYLLNNFKHIKWHTVFDFWTQLVANMKVDEYYKKLNPRLYPTNIDEFKGIITEVTHHNKTLNHGIHFELNNGQLGYITGLGMLSWGTVNPKRWTDFKSQILQNISFSDFTSENTFLLIEKKNLNKAIELIIAEILQEQKNNFKNLNSE
ncbi:PDDEXK-like family protein [Roseimarinus sediminis]|uniref:PDDEXK-like family protein n=1 Tax=Roseimarinus sediminis TaxID=1610899 RepID=UPI003D19CFAB